MRNAVHGKAIRKWRNGSDLRLVSNEKRISKSSYMSQKIFDNDLVEILKSQVPVTLIKPAYLWICILVSIKVLMYDYIKNEYGNKLKTSLTLII